MDPLATRAIDPDSKAHAHAYRVALAAGDPSAEAHADALRPVATAADPVVLVAAGDGEVVTVTYTPGGLNVVLASDETAGPTS